MDERLLRLGIGVCGVRLPEGAPVLELLETAMERTDEFWWVADDDLCIKSALGAVFHRLEQEKRADDFEALSVSVQSLSKVSAMLEALQRGVPVDFDRMTEEMPTDPSLYSKAITETWRRVSAGRKR